MATQALPSGKISETEKFGTADSYDSLLADVMGEMTQGLSKLSEPEREVAIAEIHAIAEKVRKRQA